MWSSPMCFGLSLHIYCQRREEGHPLGQGSNQKVACIHTFLNVLEEFGCMKRDWVFCYWVETL